ncbi:MAG: substrate-binding domain-containing protein, partial [Clostridia bacterium]
MFKLRKTLAVLVACLILCTSLVGFAAAETATPSLDEEVLALIKGKAEGVKIGITVGDLSSTWICGAVEYVTALLEGAGATVYMSNSAGDLAQQVEQIKDYVTMGCKVILIHTSNTDGIASTVNKAIEEGVQCVGFNIEIGDGA